MCRELAHSIEIHSPRRLGRDQTSHAVEVLQPSLFTDINGVNTGYSYGGDPFGRIKSITRQNADNSAQHVTSFDYGDTPGNLYVVTRRDQLAAGDGRVVEKTYFDGLGRKTAVESGVSDVIRVDTVYDALDRVKSKSNPARPAQPGESTVGVTTYAYDAIGRILSVTLPDNAVIGYSYAGAQTNIVEAGRTKITQTDAFGRLTSVVEDSGALNYTTTYQYDELDNLKGVTQGAQTRTFTYNSLKQLRTAKSPETSHLAGGVATQLDTTYTYDGNGNVKTKAEPAGFSTTYNYDAWNRLTSKTYTGGNTLGAYFCYDGMTNAGGACTGNEQAGLLGRLTAVGNGNSWTTYTVDRLGRITASEQTTVQPIGAAVTRSLQYGYYADGSLSHVQYPSGRTVTTCYDDNGRAVWASASRTEAQCPNATGGDSYAEVSKFAAHGAPAVWTLGATAAAADYNNRLQAAELRLGASGSIWTLRNEYTSAYWPANNGNVVRQVMTIPSKVATTVYGYDGVNRLTAAVESPVNGSAAPTCSAGAVNADGWCAGYGYDQWGNRTAVAGVNFVSGDAPAGFDGRTNRNAGGTWDYDDRGDQIQRGSGVKVAYDAEGRETAECPATVSTCSDQSGWATRFVYDAQGRRVRKDNGLSSTTMVYDASGELAAEYGGQAGTGTVYITTDHLGSTRVLTDRDGHETQRTDYAPFGETILATAGSWRQGYASYSADVVRQKFTGKERDAETGLDYFGARYFSGAQGRFTSPDPNGAGASIFDPQSWNAYAYVKGRPLSHIDPDGEVPIPVITGAFGAGAGAIVGGGFEALKQYRAAHRITNWGKVWTAAGGGFVAGGLSGLTLGVGAAAGVATSATEVVVTNASTSVIGGIVQRTSDEALGYDAPADYQTEIGNVTADAVTAGLFSYVGARIADKLFPIPNARREIEMLKFAHRRSTRAARIETVRQNAQFQAGANAVTGGIGGGVPTETSKWIWQWVLNKLSTPKEVITSKVCYGDGRCEGGSQ